MKKKVPHKIELSVVGIQYRVTMITRKMIAVKIEKEGPIRCKVLRDPENPKDENALKVIIAEGSYKGLHLGFLRRQVAAVYAPMIDEGTVVVPYGHLVSLDPKDGEGEILLSVKAPFSKSLEKRLKLDN